MDTARKTHIVAVGNQKGGVAKTTATCHLATALAEMGYSVLIWDLDSNAGATKSWGVPQTFLGAYEVMIGDEDPEGVILTNKDDAGKTLPERVHLIPSRRNLDNLEIDLRTRNRYADPRDSLKKPLEKLEGTYDFIFLDTAPHVTPATLAAYKAARWFVMAVTPEPLGVQGMIEALEDIKQAKEYAGSQIDLLGVLMSRVDKRTRLSTQLVQFVRENFPENAGAFSTNIGTAVAIANAQEQGKTVLQTEPMHRSAEEYRIVARELAQRLKERTATPAEAPTERTEAAGKEVVNG